MVYKLDAVKKKNASKRSSKRTKTLTPSGSSIHTIVLDVNVEREKLKKAMELNNTTYPPHPQNNGDSGRGGGSTGEDDLLNYLRNRDEKQNKLEEERRVKESTDGRSHLRVRVRLIYSH